MSDQKQSGQILIVVLIIALVATLSGLIIYTRSLSEASSTISQEEKDKTFNRTEDSLRMALSGDPADYDGAITEFIEGQTISFELVKNSVIEAEVDGTIYFLWPECEAVLVQGWNGPSLSAYHVYRPNGCSDGDVSVFGNTNVRESYIDLEDGAFLSGYSSVRIKPLTGDINVTLSGDINNFVTIPAEEMGQANIFQRQEADRSGNFLPEIFDYVLYSGESIIKDN